MEHPGERCMQSAPHSHCYHIAITVLSQCHHIAPALTPALTQSCCLCWQGIDSTFRKRWNCFLSTGSARPRWDLHPPLRPLIPLTGFRDVFCLSDLIPLASMWRGVARYPFASGVARHVGRWGGVAGAVLALGVQCVACQHPWRCHAWCVVARRGACGVSVQTK